MVSTIGIVSLSSGVIGEDFVKHEVDLGAQRLKDLGLNPCLLYTSDVYKRQIVNKASQDFKQASDILGMKSCRWLIQNVERFSCRAFMKFASQLHTLSFSSRKGDVYKRQGCDRVT